MSNLIDNALKYGAGDCGSGGRIDVVARREGSQIVIEVADHGDARVAALRCDGSRLSYDRVGDEEHVRADAG